MSVHVLIFLYVMYADHMILALAMGIWLWDMGDGNGLGSCMMCPDVLTVMLIWGRWGWHSSIAQSMRMLGRANPLLKLWSLHSPKWLFPTRFSWALWEQKGPREVRKAIASTGDPEKSSTNLRNSPKFFFSLGTLTVLKIFWVPWSPAPRRSFGLNISRIPPLNCQTDKRQWVCWLQTLWHWVWATPDAKEAALRQLLIPLPC